MGLSADCAPWPVGRRDRGTNDVAEIDPDRFNLRQVDALREDYAQVMEELDLVKELLARLPTRRERSGRFTR